ncbi:glutamate racemase [Novosphingobium aquimarinum]|uniref:glutamate racemase n=1 Tax=Novosphingobium aquimarinum TaxID=2682494 RepID=UPI0012EB568B|nr:glutamate racemase [Novosphingobium aquimarinum]
MTLPDRIDPTAPVLLFDSGVGGLTVLREIRQLLPDAPVVYAADNAGLPYGTKTEAQVAARVCGLLGRITERLQPRLVCIACNTASTIALGMVRDVLEIPVVGTVPAIKPAAALTRSGVIGLLGTEATIRQDYVDRLEAEFAQDKTLLRYGAPRLVEAAEAKLRGVTPDPDAVREAVDGLRSMPGGEAMDALVLACTHFPLLADELQAALGPEVRLVHGAEGIARQVARLLAGQMFERARPDLALFTADGPGIASLAPCLESYGLPNIDVFSKR